MVFLVAARPKNQRDVSDEIHQHHDQNLFVIRLDAAALFVRVRDVEVHAIAEVVAKENQQRSYKSAPNKPIAPAALAVALPLAAVAPSVAALAEIVSAGSAARTPSVKTFPGFVRSSAPST